MWLWQNFLCKISRQTHFLRLPHLTENFTAKLKDFIATGSSVGREEIWIQSVCKKECILCRKGLCNESPSSVQLLASSYGVVQGKMPHFTDLILQVSKTWWIFLMFNNLYSTAHPPDFHLCMTALLLLVNSWAGNIKV